MSRFLVALMEHVIYHVVKRVTTARVRMRLRVRGVTCGPGLSVYGGVDIRIHRTAKVTIGRRNRWNSGFLANPVGGYRRLGIWVGRNAVLAIGNDVGLSSSTIVCSHAITIHDGVFVGGDCHIYDTDVHSMQYDRRIAQPDLGAKWAPIVIKEQCFIGARCIILKGVTIGRRAVVAAGSVVTRDVPDGEVWGGNPVRRLGIVQD